MKPHAFNPLYGFHAFNPLDGKQLGDGWRHVCGTRNGQWRENLREQLTRCHRLSSSVLGLMRVAQFSPDVFQHVHQVLRTHAYPTVRCRSHIGCEHIPNLPSPDKPFQFPYTREPQICVLAHQVN